MSQNDIRRFNRFELKYILDVDFAKEIQKKLEAYLIADTHGDDGNYVLSSLYYDTDDFRFYWEKVEGIKFRRKIRIRHYETEKALTAKSPVYVEVKQRLDRVTQKRRIKLTYADALKLCNEFEMPESIEEQDRATAEELYHMLTTFQLKPTCITSYHRKAFNGGESDPGLRVTFDTNLRYRRNNIELGEKQMGPFMLPPNKCIMEIKANDRVPYWLTEFVADQNISLMRISKYCQSLEQAESVPRPSYQYE